MNNMQKRIQWLNKWIEEDCNSESEHADVNLGGNTTEYIKGFRDAMVEYGEPE